MKKFLLSIAVVMALQLAAYGADTSLMGMKSKLMDESKAVKGLIQTSTDAILVNNMWDSCVVAITQLDAYFYMLGIFNTIKRENVTANAVEYLTRWLDGMKKSNSLNIESLKSITYEIDPTTQAHIKILTGYFAELNSKIDGELDRVGILARATAGSAASTVAGKK